VRRRDPSEEVFEDGVSDGLINEATVLEDAGGGVLGFWGTGLAWGGLELLVTGDFNTVPLAVDGEFELITEDRGAIALSKGIELTHEARPGNGAFRALFDAPEALDEIGDIGEVIRDGAFPVMSLPRGVPPLGPPLPDTLPKTHFWGRSFFERNLDGSLRLRICQRLLRWEI
jgi:hypothetical protein